MRQPKNEMEVVSNMWVLLPDINHGSFNQWYKLFITNDKKFMVEDQCGRRLLGPETKVVYDAHFGQMTVKLVTKKDKFYLQTNEFPR